MPRDCSAIQEDLVRYSGHIDRLEGADRNHLEHCIACEKVAREEYGMIRDGETCYRVEPLSETDSD